MVRDILLPLKNVEEIKYYISIIKQDNLSKNFIDNIKLVVPPSDFIEKMNLAAIVEQMTLNTREISLLENLQSTILAQLSSN